MDRESWSSRIVEEVRAVHSEMILPELLGGRFLMRNGPSTATTLSALRMIVLMLVVVPLTHLLLDSRLTTN